MSAAEFNRWVAFLAMEPDLGTRMDYLAAGLAAAIARVEGTLGGKPPRISGKMIEWDRCPEDDEKELAAWLEGFGKRADNS